VKDTGKQWNGIPVYVADDDGPEFTIINVGSKDEPKPALVVGQNLENSYERELDKVAVNYLVGQVLSGKSEPLNEAARQETRKQSHKAMKVTYPDGEVEIIKGATEAKKTGDTTMEFRDEYGGVIKTVDFTGMLRYETIQVEK
jgi:hypothetical protein